MVPGLDSFYTSLYDDDEAAHVHCAEVVAVSTRPPTSNGDDVAVMASSWSSWSSLSSSSVSLYHSATLDDAVSGRGYLLASFELPFVGASGNSTSGDITNITAGAATAIVSSSSSSSSATTTAAAASAVATGAGADANWAVEVQLSRLNAVQLKSGMQLVGTMAVVIVVVMCTLCGYNALVSQQPITPIYRMIKLIKKLAGTIFAMVSE